MRKIGNTNTYNKILNEATVRRVYDHIKDGFFIISGCVCFKNSDLQQCKNEKDFDLLLENLFKINNQNTKDLINDIRNLGFSFIKLNGTYTYNQGTDFEYTSEETSFFVPFSSLNKKQDNKTNFEFDYQQVLQKVFDLMYKYNQESFIISDVNNSDILLLGETLNEDREYTGENIEIVLGDMHVLTQDEISNFASRLKTQRFVFESLGFVQPNNTNSYYVLREEGNIIL